MLHHFRSAKYSRLLAVVLSVGVFISTSTILPAYAASLTALSDTMSIQSDAVASNHTIKFTTPTGAGDVGDTITIAFAAGFVVGSVDYTDIDLSHGASTGAETEETLAATADGTSWGASFSSTTLTLTHPTSGTAGDIAPSDKVIVEIGLNAASGNAQLTNPASGTHLIVLGGTFGDSGQIAVVVIDDNQVVVGTTIDPYIAFTVTGNVVTLTKAGGGNPNFSSTGYNNGTANTLEARTNASSGYTLTYSGSTLTSPDLDTIDAMSVKGTSSAGTEQFGLNLKDNATPNTGANASGGTGTPAADYNTADQYRFVADAITTLASAAGSTAATTYTVSYIANVSDTTEAGSYSTTITYVLTGNF